jgi:hypothetical protein
MDRQYQVRWTGGCWTGRGDEAAFSALFARYQGPLYRYVVHMGRPEAGDDVVQETFLAVLRGNGRYDPTRGPLIGYLIGIARHQPSSQWAGFATRGGTAGQTIWFTAVPPTPAQTQLPAGVRPVEESLGTRVIEGVKAAGRKSTTIPAGLIGNDRPIVITDERWESPELKVIVLSRFPDPRTGEVEYQSTNINRSEPPPDLFIVPPGYEILGGGERTGGAGGRGARTGGPGTTARQ